MQQSNHTVQTSPRRRARAALIFLAFAALGLGACSPGSTGVPSIGIPSGVLPTTNPSGSPVAACMDAATMAVIDQLKAPGADVATILTANKDVLVNGLNSLKPADPATTTWRDALVKAIQDGDTTAAKTQIDALVSGGVTLTAC